VSGGCCSLRSSRRNVGVSTAARRSTMERHCTAATTMMMTSLAAGARVLAGVRVTTEADALTVGSAGTW
jgi:hypothetical protein